MHELNQFHATDFYGARSITYISTSSGDARNEAELSIRPGTQHARGLFKINVLRLRKSTDWNLIGCF